MEIKGEQPHTSRRRYSKVILSYILKIFISLIGSLLVCILFALKNNQEELLKNFDPKIFTHWLYPFLGCFFILEFPKIAFFICLVSIAVYCHVLMNPKQYESLKLTIINHLNVDNNPAGFNIFQILSTNLQSAKSAIGNHFKAGNIAGSNIPEKLFTD